MKKRFPSATMLAVLGSVFAVWLNPAGADEYPRLDKCWRPTPSALKYSSAAGYPFLCQAARAKTAAERRYWLLRGADKGIGVVQFWLSREYLIGSSGFPKDDQKYRFWLEKAAKSGWPQAQHLLALYLFRGSGFTEDRAKARYWLSQSAEKAPRSKLALSLYYRNGVGGRRDVSMADKLMKEALDSLLALRREWKRPPLAPAEVSYRLARHALCPWAAPVDLATARRFLERAARQGHAKAKRVLAMVLTDTEVQYRLCSDWPHLTDKVDR